MSYKYCPGCDKSLDLTKFYKRNKKRKDGTFNTTTQSTCIECSKIRRENYYTSNRAKEIEVRKIRESSIKSWFIEFKKTLSCSSCSEDRYYVLDFHHIDDNKEYNLGDITSGRYGKTKILNELKKCVPLCANCHREIHYPQNNIT